MKIASPWKRLQGNHFWRAVDREHNRIIIEQLAGCTHILDLGCGYGSLTAALQQAGFQAVGVDADAEQIAQARALFPEAANALFPMDAARLQFPDQRFDAVVLRDTLHHLWEEADTTRAFSEIERILRPGGRLVIFDPNPNFVVRTARRLIAHQDAECTFQEARTWLEQRDWKIQRQFFTELFALPLSGGYVGLELVPAWPALHPPLIAANRILSSALSRWGLGPHLLWRYVLTAVRQTSFGASRTT